MINDLANSQDLVFIDGIKDGALILKDGSLRQILMVQGLNFSLKSPEEQGMITMAYQNFLNSIDFDVQIVIHSRKININKYLKDLDLKLEAETSPLLQNQISEYREFVRKFVEDNAIMEKTFLVVVPWYPPVIRSSKSGGLNIPFISKKADPKIEDAAKEADFQQNMVQLRQRSTQIMEGLNAIGLESIILNDEELVELVYNFYNPETIEREELAMPNGQ